MLQGPRLPFACSRSQGFSLKKWASFFSGWRGSGGRTLDFGSAQVLLNIAQGWGPASDTWTLGITAAFLVSGDLLFNSHEPPALVRGMVEAIGEPAFSMAAPKTSRSPP